jgi:hypothetical protein
MIGSSLPFVNELVSKILEAVFNLLRRGLMSDLVGFGDAQHRTLLVFCLAEKTAAVRLVYNWLSG